MSSITPTQDDVTTLLGGFLRDIIAADFVAVVGQVNRVPEPVGSNYAVMWPLRMPRLATNLDDFADTKFTASIDDTSLIVTAVAFGTLKIGAVVFGVDVAANTTIVSGPGGGGVGTYVITPTQTVASRTMAAGQQTFEQDVNLVFQLDIHGPAGTDNAGIVSTMFRDAYAVDWFAARSERVIPLFADDPRQGPFLSGEEQYEDRWIVEISLQVNYLITAPQQFADAITVVVTNVEAQVN